MKASLLKFLIILFTTLSLALFWLIRNKGHVLRNGFPREVALDDPVNYSVSDVEIVREKYKTTIKGQIWNRSNKKLNGYVKIKAKDSHGTILDTYKTRVNDGDDLLPGQSAVFRTHVDPNESKEIKSVDVVFVSRT